MHELSNLRAGVVGIVVVVQQTLDLLGAQRTEPIDDAPPAFVSLGGAVVPLDRPARPRGLLVRWTSPARLGAARMQVPTRQKGLHPADPLDGKPQVLDQVLDLLDSADVYLRTADTESPTLSLRTPMEITGSSFSCQVPVSGISSSVTATYEHEATFANPLLFCIAKLHPSVKALDLEAGGPTRGSPHRGATLSP